LIGRGGKIRHDRSYSVCSSTHRLVAAVQRQIVIPEPKRRQQPALPSGAEAIRRLIEAGLRAEAPPAPKAAGKKKGAPVQ
jgi:hypothetical protein